MKTETLKLSGYNLESLERRGLLLMKFGGYTVKKPVYVDWLMRFCVVLERAAY